MKALTEFFVRFLSILDIGYDCIHRNNRSGFMFDWLVEKVAMGLLSFM